MNLRETTSDRFSVSQVEQLTSYPSDSATTDFGARPAGSPSLRTLVFPSFLDTSSNNLIDEFFTPALTRSIRYDRGVGFFSSGWLRIAAQGMVAFAANGGKSRWVTSPILTEQDWEAMQAGDSARSDAALRAALQRNIGNLATALERDTLSALAWMVADQILDFKLALPHSKLDQGDFHDKFGVFSDAEGNQVSFNGSYNDSIQGTRNYESIKIFCSWHPAFAPLVTADANRFERLWGNLDPNVRVYELPDAARQEILKLRTSDRPYPEPEWVRLRRLRESSPGYQPSRPRLPSNVTLREYQNAAIEAWFLADCRGILEMATGTGKTITALAASVKLLEKTKRFVLVIACPYKHLVEQWSMEAEKFGYRPILVAESRAKWKHELALQLRGFRKKQNDLVTVVTTNASLARGVLTELLEPTWPETFLLVDEAHHAGAAGMLKALPDRVPWRLGLSATPVRHYDEEGTESILNYFGPIVYEFGLEDAIGTYLTPYYYHPIPVQMTHDDFDEFSRLTRKLQLNLRGPNEPMTETAKRIAIMRSRVLNNSSSKLQWLAEAISEDSEIAHTLFYVGDKLFQPTKQLLGVNKRIRIHEFTERQNIRERQEILERFSSGELQALVAMKCLDEGVDVPPTRVAYFLASSGNPREFVQRRGRVLRRSPGKNTAVLYDLISVPPEEFIGSTKDDAAYASVQAAVRREYRRIKEFASLALNHYQALEAMFEIANMLDVIDE